MTERRPVRDSALPMRIIEGEAFVLTPRDNRMHNLNEVGTRIYELSDGTHTVDQLVEALMEEYEVSREQALADCLAYLGELEGLGLIRYLEDREGS